MFLRSDSSGLFYISTLPKDGHKHLLIDNRQTIFKKKKSASDSCGLFSLIQMLSYTNRPLALEGG